MLTRRKAPRLHESPARANALYGYGYRPDWPSILSVAHDSTDGGGLFIIMDRPCVLLNPPVNPATLPLVVGSLHPLEITQILPIKFRVRMNAIVPQGAAWTWEPGPSPLVDPITNNVPNPGSGNCADVRGPYTPPPPAVVILATPNGSTCELQFDRPIVFTSFPPGPPDGAILFDGLPADTVGTLAPDRIEFSLQNAVSPGSSWEIAGQPSWIATPLSVPANGTF
jgi:hypothetical protein